MSDAGREHRAHATFEIAGHAIGRGRCFVIAEAGVNHDGDLSRARALVAAAAEAGADAVKFQTFQAEALASPAARKADYQSRAGDHGESQLEMLRRLQLSHDAFRALRDECAAAGIAFLSSAFDESSATFLAGLGVEAIKLGSGELTDLPLLTHVGRLGRPVILSTGMATLDDVAQAVAAVQDAGDDVAVSLLHCVSSYPSQPAQANLRAMDTLAAEFGVPVGFSDHTPGTDVALAAVARGAAILEKHLTLDRTLPGPDHAFATEPGDFGRMVASLRAVESALGDGVKRPDAGELPIAAVARKSLAAARDLPAGTILTHDAIAVLRPGTGIPPRDLARVLGARLRVPVAAGELLRLDDLEANA